MYEPVSNKVNFSEVEQDILEFWQKNQVFQKSLNLSEKEHIFYDGPPFPTGNPHHGTLFVSVLKDSVARFYTMAGYMVPRRWGWDCHGLPIENAVEKELGIQKKAEIEEKIGVDQFNRECRHFVSNANDAWENYINKIGRWTEYKNSYRTMDTSFMESVLWVFQQSYKKNLIYKDYRVTPYCYHCETSLSISDTRESDSTRPRQDPSVVVRFRAHDDVQGKPTYYLAWTTTPWTLVSNLALAVHKDFDYVAVEHEGEVYLLAENLLPKYQQEFGETPQVLKTFKGNELVGKTYEPLFPYFQEAIEEGCFRILDGDFVTLEDGVGIVHLAPAFGEDDYWLCKRNGIGVKNPVNAAGCFHQKIEAFAGKNVHDANRDIIHSLKEEGKLFRQDTIEHNYPHCWRCRNPLIYRAMDAWYFAVEKLKDRLIHHNKEINWVPSHVKDGRFGNWLEGVRDWNISRSRYWGTPIPIWECDHEGCDHRVVLGSVEEIAKVSKTRPADLHKEYLDPITFPCKKCSSESKSSVGTMRRVPEVLDCWFESGSMPYGQCHYPFENKEWFETHFPTDFIIEYPGQIRCWFYYLHVLAVALFDRPAFKNCVVHGTLLAEDGSKISKSKKNYTDPMVLIDTYGADAMRIYLLNSPAATMADLNFKDSGIAERVKTVLLPMWNAYSFFTTYANIDRYEGDPNRTPEPKNALDSWVLAKLYQAEKEVYEAFSTYQLNRTLTPLLEVLDSLTNWYIRRSRERFWGKGMGEDKKSAYDTLYYVLISMVKMLAPSAPFITEKVYRALTCKESVHLEAWPKIPDHFQNEKLIQEFELVRLITTLGLSLRQKAKIKVRQPLPLLRVALPKEKSPEILEAQLSVLQDELNVKKVEVLEDPTQVATLRAVPNAKILGRRLGKAMQKLIQGAREGNVREQGEKVIVFHEDEAWVIDREEISIGYEGKNGLDVASSHGVLVVLDTEISSELREEGVANDVNRVIQDLRKEAGYEINDSIQLHLEGELKEQWVNHLAHSSLAELTPLGEEDADQSRSKQIDGREFLIRIKKKAIAA